MSYHRAIIFHLCIVEIVQSRRKVRFIYAWFRDLGIRNIAKFHSHYI